MNITTTTNPDPTKGHICNYDYDDTPEPLNLPNLDKMLDTLLDVVSVMSNQEMTNLRKTNYPEYEFKMRKEFPAFSINYDNIFTKIIKGEDINTMLMMFTAINKVQKNKASFEEVDKIMMEKLQKEHIHKK